MDKFSNTYYEDELFAQKLQQLLLGQTFLDVSFNCRDGKVEGNRLILSVYSQFLENIFEKNPLMTAHPLNEDETSGINLPEVSTKDMKLFLKIINSVNEIEISADDVKTVQRVAKMLQTELVVGQKKNGLVGVEAMPKTITDSDDDLMDDEDLCEQSMTEEKDSLYVAKANSSKIDDEEKSRVCPVCSITCKSWQGMKRHIGHIHKEVAKANKLQQQQQLQQQNKQQQDHEEENGTTNP